MPITRRSPLALVAAQFVGTAFFASALGGDLDAINLPALLAAQPELTGSGQTVALVEAPIGGAYQVSPAAIGQPSGIFRYYDDAHTYGTSGASFSEALASGHATLVGAHLAGVGTGVAPGAQTVENFEAGYFVNEIVIHLVTSGSSTSWQPVPIAAPIVNQSFIFTNTSANEIAQINFFYDAYSAIHGTLFVNGLANGSGSLTHAPASMYNGIAVGLMNGQHVGKALIVAPGTATSFATPYVSGAAAILRQAAAQGDFQALSNAADALDARVLKAGLLNGATKTEGWSHSSTSALDATFGAGVLNVSGSYDTLAGGQHAQNSTNLTARNVISTTAAFTGALTATSGWDLRALTAAVNQDAVNHYFFDLSASGTYTLTATLTWNSIVNFSDLSDSISNFDLVLVDLNAAVIVWSSASTTENIEHIYSSGLAASKYDLQVILRGGPNTPALTDTYALAFSWQNATPVPEPICAWPIVTLCGITVWRLRSTRRRA